MSGPEIITIISVTVEAIGIIKTVWDAIKDANGLPAAFRKVHDELPLVEDTLERAKNKAEGGLDSSSAGLVLDTVTKCRDKVQELKGIFQKIKASKDSERSVKRLYHDIVIPLGKGHRVEELMQDILGDVKNLAANQVFQLAAQVDVLQRAIDELAEVEPSVPDRKLQSGQGSHYNVNEGSGTFNALTAYGDGDNVSVAAGGTFNKAEEMYVGGGKRSDYK